ncbi:imelysin family protein [Paracoccus sp. M683]|uniref:imelysin family protein n=1 Tax=Paracoccus sp. M683 TaxID=2594268 RepID=UPI00117C1374|nr:imelysin family protein [Paracoccus sp. M683]TRW98196.1 imelysin family protein [Paracoccus sp. M683]
MRLTRPLFLATVLALGLAQPAAADVPRAVQDQILPGFADFAGAARQLADAAGADCDAQALRPAYDAAFDAWMRVGHLRLGPGETAVLSIAFWPDTRGAGSRALARLLADRDPVADDPVRYARESAAARGFFAFEALVFDDAYAAEEGAATTYRCQLITTVAADLAAQAEALDRDWRDGFAPVLTSAGQPGNTIYLAPQEAVQALYTQLMVGLEFTEDQRLARPLDSFDNPHPKRAEAWRSARSLANLRASLAAQRALALALVDTPIPVTQAAFDAADQAAERIVDPGFQDIGDPQAWLRLDVLRQRVQAVRQAVEAEIGTALGVAAGFNSADGD